MKTIDKNKLDTAIIGFGPAGIALACAVDDWGKKNTSCAMPNIKFFEKAPSTEWHGDFLLRDTDINHHIFRDLVTPRDPQSRFSFAMYLHEKGRLYSFGLLGRPPSRAEWSDYLRWAANQLSQYVEYENGVRAIAPIVHQNRLAGFNVLTERGEYSARRLVLSFGSQPRIPQLFANVRGSNIFHTSKYLSSLRSFGKDMPLRWLVIGSGQSAGEAIADLISRRNDISIESVHRSIGFRIGQLGQFPNRVFSPEQIDLYHSLSHEKRKALFEEAKSTNYAGIDVDESQALYSLIYEDGIEGRNRLNMHAFKNVRAVEELESGYEVQLEDVFTGNTYKIEVDAIVLGTGFEQPLIPPLLTDILPWLQTETDGGLVIDRDYRVGIEAHSGVEIYANGLSERAHGISDAQSFSLVAMRADRIFNCLISADRIEASRLSAAL